MQRTTDKWLAIAIAIIFLGGIAACARVQDGDSATARDTGAMSEANGTEGGEQAGEHAEGRERGGEEAGEHGEGEGRGEHGEGGGGEHGEGGHDEGGEEGEESGVYIARADTWDRTRRGARLVLTFDTEKGAFVGTVENTTDATLCAVRVEVHLDTPRELGPTARTDVPAGETIDVELSSEGQSFETWTAHPELSACGG